MYEFKTNPYGLYEKALPDTLSWEKKIEEAKGAGFDFLEISVDESDERLGRLNWDKGQRKHLRTVLFDHDFSFRSMCLSGHRRFSLGSEDPDTRYRALEIMKRGIELAYDLGVRNIQLAGYDVYYEPQTKRTHELFVSGLRQSVKMAEAANVILSLEIMDTPYLSSIRKYLSLTEQIQSSYLKVYPDVGNITAWNNDIAVDLRAGGKEIVAIHLKDTLKVKEGFAGLFRDLVHGEGEVNFDLVFQTLREINYNGPFVLEMWAKKERSYKEDIANALIFVKEKAKKAGFFE